MTIPTCPSGKDASTYFSYGEDVSLFLSLYNHRSASTIVDLSGDNPESIHLALENVIQSRVVDSSLIEQSLCRYPEGGGYGVKRTLQDDFEKAARVLFQDELVFDVPKLPPNVQSVYALYLDQEIPRKEELDRYLPFPLEDLHEREIVLFRSLFAKDGEDLDEKDWIVKGPQSYGEEDGTYFSKSIPIPQLDSVRDVLNVLAADKKNYRAQALQKALGLVEQEISTQDLTNPPFSATRSHQETFMGKKSDESWSNFIEPYQALPPYNTLPEVSEETLLMGHLIWRPLIGSYYPEDISILRLYLGDDENKDFRITAGPNDQGAYNLAIRYDSNLASLQNALAILYEDTRLHVSHQKISNLNNAITVLRQGIEMEDGLNVFRHTLVIGGAFGCGAEGVKIPVELFMLPLLLKYLRKGPPNPPSGIPPNLLQLPSTQAVEKVVVTAAVAVLALGALLIGAGVVTVSAPVLVAGAAVASLLLSAGVLLSDSDPSPEV